MTPSPIPQPNASWLETKRSCLEHNVALFRQVLKADGGRASPRLGGVLKGNAYGHGFEPMLAELHSVLDVIYVIMAADALALRALEAERGWARRQVVVIGAVTAAEVRALAERGVQCVLGDPSWERIGLELRAQGSGLRAQVHVHLDTGLGREGFRPEAVARDLAFLPGMLDVLEPVGALTHFANTEDVTEQNYAQGQLAAFDAGVAELQKLLPGLPLERHAAASAAAMLLPEARYEVVRVGIGLFGLWPSNETRISARLVHPDWNSLQPALSWRCRSQLVKSLPAGSYIGYGCSFRCERDTTVAVLPVGYFDGYPRLTSARAHVLVNGRRCPVVGRVMMNHIIVDITLAAPQASEVVATLLGEDGGESISAETLAAWAQTINYEIVTRLGAHLRRKVI